MFLEKLFSFKGSRSIILGDRETKREGEEEEERAKGGGKDLGG